MLENKEIDQATLDSVEDCKALPVPPVLRQVLKIMALDATKDCMASLAVWCVHAELLECLLHLPSRSFAEPIVPRETARMESMCVERSK